MLEKKAEKQRKNARLVLLAAALLLAALLLLGHFAGGRGKNAQTAQDRLDFLSSLGWEVDPASEQTQTVTVPDCSEGAMADYNALLQRGGYDLSDYAGKNVEQFQYELLNYPGETQTVYLTLYVYHGRVIGGDIHTAALNGFMHELRPNE